MNDKIHKNKNDWLLRYSIVFCCCAIKLEINKSENVNNSIEHLSRPAELFHLCISMSIFFYTVDKSLSDNFEGAHKNIRFPSIIRVFIH